MNKIQEDYRLVFRIRNFEKKILELFSQNKLTGTTHTCIGQEATPVALMDYIAEKDSIFGSHRSHGYFISYAKTYKPLLAEIMGKATGMCRGRGGSQHVCYQNYTTNGVQGGIVPNATGIALAEKYKNSGGIAVAILGDGTLGQGVVYESMNMAAIFDAPVLYIIEDNAYAMTTPSSYAVAGNMAKRIEGFGLKVAEIESNDTTALREYFKMAVDYVRSETKPMCCIVHTYRLGPHSKGDDFRDVEELNTHWKNDPLLLLEKKLDSSICQKIREEEMALLEKTIAEIENDVIEGKEAICPDYHSGIRRADSVLNFRENIRCISAINESLKAVLTNDDRSVILGEDIRDPYGGPFKATKDLTTLYPDRIINTPISEAGMIGIGIGMAMHGLHPIVEMMFGDFLSLGFDQILNHAGKYNWMYAGQINVPLVIRAPMGGKRGYGATHSQSLEKFMVGIPGIDVIAPSIIHDPIAIFANVYEGIDRPTIVIEDKALYGQRLLISKDGKIGDFFVEEEKAAFPLISLMLDTDETADVAVLTYGGLVKDAMEAAEKLMMEDEILVKIIVFTRISPVDYSSLIDRIGDVEKIVTVEGGTERVGWGAEIISAISERTSNKKFKRIASVNLPVPCNKSLEEQMIPGTEMIVRTIKKFE